MTPQTVNDHLSPSCTILTAEARAVLSTVQRHRGRGRAVGLEVVAGLTGLSERNVQEIIAHLIEHHGYPIGSAVKKPMGYFLIETQDELDESVSQLLHRLTALARRIAALKHSTTPLVLQQLALDLDQPPEAA